MIRKAFFCSAYKDAYKNKLLTHVPVLLDEVIRVYQSVNNKIVLDLTFGFGGHSRALLNCNKNTKHIAVDRDLTSYHEALNLCKTYPQLVAVHGKFSDLFEICQQHNISEHSVDFILMDLGANSMQMDDGNRGFSISKNGKLDMRMNQQTNEISAYDVINNLSAIDLSDIFKKYGDDINARKVANMIVEYRTSVGPILTTFQLAEIIAKCVGWGHHHDSLRRKVHPATQIFLALRIFVNDELNQLCFALTFAQKYLTPISGRCVVISFHSLEDQLVNWAFHGKDFNGVNKSISKIVNFDFEGKSLENYQWTQIGDVILPTKDEINKNSRARSAKLRVGKIVHN